jgi:hypothetical protein
MQDVKARTQKPRRGADRPHTRRDVVLVQGMGKQRQRDDPGSPRETMCLPLKGAAARFVMRDEGQHKAPSAAND